jgi:polysaccharide deacetylase family protein (PEP-CTERM system associated)
MNVNKHILLTIDVEDWFQVENFKQFIPFTSWSSFKFRVEKNTHRLLDVLDCIKVQQLAMSDELGCRSKPKATFFVLGWIAEHLPHLVLEIRLRGHEVGSHGYSHKLCSQSSHEDLKRDLVDSRKLLEDILGDRVFGYRAPSFSVDDEILKIIEESGYLYDSSFNSFGMNKRYGRVTLPSDGKKGMVHKVSDFFYELPISNMSIGKYTLPWGGGGYFRVTPFWLFRLGVKSILKKERAYLFYMHPWEIDPEQPRVKEASIGKKLRHYAYLDRSEPKIFRLVESFDNCHFPTCYQYIEEMID